MAFQTEGPHIREIAFSPALRDGNNMVGIPQRPAEALLEIPLAQEPVPGFVVQLQEMQPQADGVEAATGAYALVPLENPIA